MWHDLRPVCVPWLEACVCPMTWGLYVSHDLRHACVTWLEASVCHMTWSLCMSHDLKPLYVTWLEASVCHMTWGLCVTWLKACVSHDLRPLCVTWLKACVCHMTWSLCVSHDLRPVMVFFHQTTPVCFHCFASNSWFSFCCMERIIKQDLYTLQFHHFTSRHALRFYLNRSKLLWTSKTWPISSPTRHHDSYRQTVVQMHHLRQYMCLCYCLFVGGFMLATSKVTSGLILTCDSAHWWQFV